MKTDDDEVSVICAELAPDVVSSLNVVVIKVVVEELSVFEVMEVLEVEVTAQVKSVSQIVASV